MPSTKRTFTRAAQVSLLLRLPFSEPRFLRVPPEARSFHRRAKVGESLSVSLVRVSDLIIRQYRRVVAGKHQEAGKPSRRFRSMLDRAVAERMLVNISEVGIHDHQVRGGEYAVLQR